MGSLAVAEAVSLLQSGKEYRWDEVVMVMGDDGVLMCREATTEDASLPRLPRALRRVFVRKGVSSSLRDWGLV